MLIDVIFDGKVFALAAGTGNRAGVYRHASSLTEHLSSHANIQVNVFPD